MVRWNGDRGVLYSRDPFVICHAVMSGRRNKRNKGTGARPPDLTTDVEAINRCELYLYDYLPFREPLSVYPAGMIPLELNVIL